PNGDYGITPSSWASSITPGATPGIVALTLTTAIDNIIEGREYESIEVWWVYGPHDSDRTRISQMSFTLDDPVVAVDAIDPAASEDPRSDTAAFLFTRSGGIDQPLTIQYLRSGTAQATDDYDSTPFYGMSVTIPAGLYSTIVLLEAVDDT